MNMINTQTAEKAQYSTNAGTKKQQKAQCNTKHTHINYCPEDLVGKQDLLAQLNYRLYKFVTEV